MDNSHEDQFAVLTERASQLQHALDSRIVIEQAVGMLGERFDLSMQDAFEVLRRGSRDSRRGLRELATELTQTRATPPEISAALKKVLP